MKAGLLPLYIDIYDVHSRHVRPRLRAFYARIAELLEERGIDVVRTPDFCCLKAQFEEAVTSFEEASADAIVTLHMAYSPSLEAIDALTGTDLPVIVLDTTETVSFSSSQNKGEIMYNHGIHGVMDLCSLLKRRGKPFAIAAGHYAESDVIDRTVGFIRAAVAARAVASQKTALFGGSFAGMGDFGVEPEELRSRFGIKVEHFRAEDLDQAALSVPEEEAEAEEEADRERFEFPEETDMAGYRKAVQVGLGLRKLLEEKGMTAFTINFRTVPQIPFIECCKAMERGIGYAGEGDALTASFLGAWLSSYPEAGFVEIFCPDWEHDTLFLSHMGEVNYRISDTRPLVRHAGGFVDTFSAYTRMKGGKGIYVNVSRGPEDYELLAAPAEMLSVESDSFRTSMRGWMRPLNGMTTAAFLEALSENGATHHSFFVYGATAEEAVYFGRLLKMKTVVV